MTLLLKGPFKGSSTIKGYEGWTPIQSLQWGAGRAVSNGAAPQLSRISVSEVTLTKALDQSTADMARLLGATVPISLQIVELQTRPAGGAPYPELTLVLGNSLATGFSTSSGGDRPSESFSFHFATLNATMKGLDSTGAVIDTGSYAYDVVNGTTI